MTFRTTVSEEYPKIVGDFLVCHDDIYDGWTIKKLMTKFYTMPNDMFIVNMRLDGEHIEVSYE